MVWSKTLLVLLPIVTGQIIFPGELEWSLSTTIASTATAVPEISSSLDPLVTSTSPSTSAFASSLVSSFSVLSTTSPVSSISLSLNDVSPIIPGSVSKASITPVLRPSPVTSGPEFSSASTVQPPKRPWPDSLHPEVQKSDPVTPTPINVMQIAPSRFPNQIPTLEFEPEPSVETTVSSKSLTSASTVASTSVVSTLGLTEVSSIPAKTTTGLPLPGESTESATSSSTPEEFSTQVDPSHPNEPFNSGEISDGEEASLHEEPLHRGESPKPGNFSNSEDSSHHEEPSDQENSLHHREPLDSDDSSHHGESPNPEESSHQDDSLHLIESLNPAASFTTAKAVTSEPPSATTVDPKIIDQILTNAVITMGDAQDVDVGDRNRACLTPLGEPGTCIVFKDCAGYSSLTNHMDNKTVIRFLRSRVCKLLPRAILFCCPNVTPVLPLGF